MRNLVNLTFTLTLLVMLADAVLSVWNNERLIANHHRVAEAHEVVAQLDLILSTMKDAETGQRGFLLTGPGHEGYLTPYTKAVARVRRQLSALRDLLKDDVEQQKHLGTLERNINDKLDDLARTIRLRRSQGFDLARQAILTGKGKQDMEAIRATVSEMKAREKESLALRAVESGVSARVTRLSLPLGAILSVALLTIAFGLVRRDSERNRRAAALIRQEREWLEVTLRSIGDGVIATNPQGRVRLMNPVAQHLTGWPQGEAVGRDVAEVFAIVNENTRKKIDNPVDRCLREGEVVELAHHILLIARDAVERPIADSAAPIRDGAGEVQGFVLVFRDVSETRRAEAERQRLFQEACSARDRAEASEARLAEAGRRKDNFLALLGHELRNPLAPIRNAVALLALPDDSVREQARAMIDRQVRHLTRLVDDLLDASRIANNKIHLRSERLDLCELVRSAVADHCPILEAAEITLDVSLAGEAIWVEGDAVRLTQVVGNLLTNAGKFTAAGGRVAVRVESDDAAGRAAVVVRDTGAGIEAEMLPRLFEPFNQADRTLDRSRGGLGLGLALVKGLLQLHGGQVQAASDGLGQGAEFTFWLPLAGPPAARGEAYPVAAVAESNLRILIIEDNRDAADSLRMVLQWMGASEIAVAYSGPEGVEEAKRFRPDVVLCDLGLPGLSGFEVARVLRGEPATAAVRLIAISGYGQEDDHRRALIAGFDLAMVKPVDPVALQRVLGQDWPAA